MTAYGTEFFSMNDVNRLRILQDVIDRRLTTRLAATRLEISDRHCRRLLERYREHGPLSLVNRRRGQPGNRQLMPGLAERALRIIREHYADFGPTLAREKLSEVHGLYLAKETVRKLMLVEASERGIFFSITETQFLQCIITLAGGQQQQPFDSIRSHLTYNWLLNDKWVRRWGELWNCNAIEHAKTEMKSYWRWRLGEFKHFSLYCAGLGPYPWNGILRKILCKLLINNHIITVQFWLAVHSGRYVLGDGKLKLNQRRIRKVKSSKASNL